MGAAFFKSFSPGAMRTIRVVAWTATVTSGPESGVKVMAPPLIPLTAPMRRFVPAACWVCWPWGGAAAQKGTRQVPPRQSATTRNHFMISLIAFFLIINLHGRRKQHLGLYKVLLQDNWVLGRG